MSSSVDQIGNYDHQNDEHYIVKVNQQYKCVCELCTCGKHKCPRPKVKGEFQTSYNNHYKNMPLIPVVPPPAVTYTERHYDPESLRTNYKECYNEKPLQEYHKQLNSSRLQNIGKSLVRPSLPNVPFYDSTSYTEQYKPYTLKNNVNPEELDLLINKKQKILDYGIKSKVRFEGSSAYNQQFKTPQSRVMRYPHPAYTKPEMPFTGSSSYKDQYKQYLFEPQRYEQYSRPKVGERVKFEGQSTYNDVYKDYKVAKEKHSVGKPCIFEGTYIPLYNYNNKSEHLYYDQKLQKLI